MLLLRAIGRSSFQKKKIQHFITCTSKKGIFWSVGFDNFNEEKGKSGVQRLLVLIIGIMHAELVIGDLVQSDGDVLREISANRLHHILLETDGLVLERVRCKLQLTFCVPHRLGYMVWKDTDFAAFRVRDCPHVAFDRIPIVRTTTAHGIRRRQLDPVSTGKFRCIVFVANEIHMRPVGKLCFQQQPFVQWHIHVPTCAWEKNLLSC